MRRESEYHKNCNIIPTATSHRPKAPASNLRHEEVYSRLGGNLQKTGKLI